MAGRPFSSSRRRSCCIRVRVRSKSKPPLLASFRFSRRQERSAGHRSKPRFSTVRLQIKNGGVYGGEASDIGSNMSISILNRVIRISTDTGAGPSALSELGFDYNVGRTGGPRPGIDEEPRRRERRL